MRRMTRMRKNEFYIEEDMEEERKSSEPCRHGWNKTDVFPMITDSSSPTTSKTMAEQIHPLYIAVDSEEEEPEPHRYNFHKNNVFSTLPVNNNTSPTRFTTRQINPITYHIKKEMIEDTRNLPSEPMDVDIVRKRIKVSPRVEEKYRLDYKVRKEHVEELKSEDVDIVFETSFRNLAVSNWNDYISNSSPKYYGNSGILTKEKAHVRKDKCLLENSDLEWINCTNKDNRFPSFDENESPTANSVPSEDIGKKIQDIHDTVGDDINNNPKRYLCSTLNLTKNQAGQLAEKQKITSDINSLCADFDKHAVLENMNKQSMNLPRRKIYESWKEPGAIRLVEIDMPMNLIQKNDKLMAKQVPRSMPTFPVTPSKPGTSSDIGSKPRVKFLTPRWIDHQKPSSSKKDNVEQNPWPKHATPKQMEINQPITDDVLKLICSNFEEEDDPFFINEEAKNILLTQAIGMTRKRHFLRI